MIWCRRAKYRTARRAFFATLFGHQPRYLAPPRPPLARPLLSGADLHADPTHPRLPSPVVSTRPVLSWGCRHRRQTIQGCLHHKLRRHHVALHYFQKALEALSKGPAAENGGEAAAAGRGGGKDGHVSPPPTCEVLYNTGLQLLLTEKPEQVRWLWRWPRWRPGSSCQVVSCVVVDSPVEVDIVVVDGGGGAGGEPSDVRFYGNRCFSTVPTKSFWVSDTRVFATFSYKVRWGRFVSDGNDAKLKSHPRATRCFHAGPTMLRARGAAVSQPPPPLAPDGGVQHRPPPHPQQRKRRRRRWR